MFKNEELMEEKFLDDGVIIKLYHSGGGATDSEVIWIKKVSQEGETSIIGKIKGYTKNERINIKRVDKNHITLNLINRKNFMNQPIVFLIDLNNKIKRNDGSPFNIPE